MRTSFIYELEEPTQPGEAQRQFNIEQSGSIEITVKNPAIDFGSDVPGLHGKQKPTLPDNLQQLFKGKQVDQLRFIPLDPPALLNIVGVECVWMVCAVMTAVQREGAEC